MNIILLSGGSGKRLWPLSNDVRSKQFIRIFKTENGEYESMVQRMYRLLCSLGKNMEITISTSKRQAASLRGQLGEGVNLCVEPERKDTFPAISLAAAYLFHVMQVSEKEPVVICPVDPCVDMDYFQKLTDMERLAASVGDGLILMGIRPACPSEKYGYILPEDENEVSRVRAFYEKPDRKTAETYIQQGALWNGGVFACQLGYLLKKAHEQIDFSDYEELYSRYGSLKPISFDYAVAEKERNLLAVRFSGRWNDLGTWNAFTEAMDDSCIGEAIMGGNCSNVHIINELNVPILAVGIRDTVISASAEGILVADKEQSGSIKTYVDSIDHQIMFAEKSWGSFQVLDVENESLTIKVTLNPGHSMNYHSHNHRDEVWVVTMGTGRTVVDGIEQLVKTGDVITMQAGCRHTVRAITELHMIEVQLGREITVYDKQKYQLDDPAVF